ncbi:hypothetical protein DL767_004790 [Monosporascus sp. MG133]|nr:hypothetical protein DL767_004790 [Monosporascus sp. MG133]
MSSFGDQTDKPAAGASSSRTSLSSEDQGGGARLDARFEALTMEPIEPGLNSVAPHGYGRGQVDLAQGFRGNGMQYPAHFQVGNVPGDGDVFMSQGVATLPLVRPAIATTGGFPGAFPQYPTGQSSGAGDNPVRIVRTRSPDANRGDRASNVDAQAFYPASACVFVANLPEGVKDARLEVEVTRAFSEFGTVFVKIRRDQKNMPFAFCQFTVGFAIGLGPYMSLANEILENRRRSAGQNTWQRNHDRGTPVPYGDGSFVIYNAQGFDIGVEEARYQLSSYGPMSKCELLHPHILEALKLSSGVLVEFTTFDPGRDVVAAFRHNPQYRVIAYDLKKALQANKPDSDEEWLQKYDVERRSVFVGNLPTDMDDVGDVLRGIMAEVGDVKDVQVIQKESRSGRGRSIVFAFIEFARPDMAEVAIKRMDGITLGGCRIRVERKSSRDRQQARRMRSHIALSEASPAQDIRAGGSENTNPTTPLRPAAAGASSAIETVSQTGGRTSNFAGAGPSHMAGYVPPYGNFPVTPQGTPGVMSPYSGAYGGSGAGYAANPYFWATPYLTDPGLASMAYYHAYYSPMPPQAQRATGHAGTPTRAAGHDGPAGSSDEGSKSA